MAFPSLPPTPDHNQLELDLLDVWESEDTFEALRAQIAGGQKFSFIDGPVTANKELGVHTAWGRTLKDVFQRYKALRGYDQRFQNGFDCQGLWIEVGVEKELGLNSKQEIEEFGLAEFARRCRDKVAWSVAQLTEGSKRLGYWMDWGNDYLTFADTNIEYIWRFLQILSEKEYLYLGHRSTEWCPRCGTSLSQHEISQSGVYQERTDPSLYVRFPLLEREGESLVVWTTTPWTLPANVAAAVHPEVAYGRRSNGEWVATDRFPDEEFAEQLPGQELVGWAYTGPFDHLEAASGVNHRVISWDEVTMDQGTGIVHIAPGCGSEDFELGSRYDLPVLAPVDEAGRFYPGYGDLVGKDTNEAKPQIIVDLDNRGLLVESAEYTHPYPHCWRCDTPLIFRVADDWYISVDELRQPLLDANATVDWTPEYMGKLMDDWLHNMGDWNISRRRFYGLPLPFWPCGCGHLNVIGSRRELEEKATAGLDQLEELHRPWIDAVTIRCEECGADDVRRVPEVGDVWLDAGIIPLSTLGWDNEAAVPGGYGTGAAAGLTGADLPDSTYWDEWFPAAWVTEMREQVRLWFYSQLFMSVAIVGKAPFKAVLGYEKMLDETGREMHGSWGNVISATDAFEKMGADVMRWQYCAHPPDRNLLFGYGKAQQVQRRLLTLWNSVKFLADYGNIEGFTPVAADLETNPEVSADIDRWMLARLDQLIVEATAALDEWRTDRLTAAFDAYMDDLSNWYIRRNRRRFYELDEAAFRTLWTALTQALRVISPVMPFLADHLWRALTTDTDAASSIHLARWPQLPDGLDTEMIEGMATARRVAEAGRRARSEAQLKLRQPLRRAVVRGAGAAETFAAHIRDELRVKEISFEEAEVASTDVAVSYKPNFPTLGPRLGGRVKDIAAALERGDYEEGDEGTVIVDGEVLTSDEVIRTERVAASDWAVSHDGALSVAIDPSLDDELILESRALDLIRQVNELRKTSGLQLTDRIDLAVGESEADVVAVHRDWISTEVLATSVEVDPEVTEPTLR